MTADGSSGWYKFTFSAGVTSVNMVINANGSTTVKTADLTRSKKGYFADGNWYDSDPRNGLTIHFKTTWAVPKLHYWNALPTETAGTTWPGVTMVSEGNGWYLYTIPNASCANVIFSNNGATQTGNLYRCTEGWYNNGVWTNTLPSGRMSFHQQEENTSGKNKFNLHSFPNPASGQATISFTLPSRAYVSLKFYNERGIEMKTLVNTILDEGTHAVSVNTEHYPSGLYISRLSVNKTNVSQKIIIVH
jgi:hypothetical protein